MIRPQMGGKHRDLHTKRIRDPSGIDVKRSVHVRQKTNALREINHN